MQNKLLHYPKKDKNENTKYQRLFELGGTL